MPPQQTTVAPRRSIEIISMWALLATIIVAIFIFIPSTTVPLTATKVFVLAAGTLITLALYILARLSRGNVIFPPMILVGALWLPAIAYALSSAFSSAPFTSSLWGSALEPDTFGFMFIAAVLGTLTALILRNAEHYRQFLKTSAFVFCAVTVIEMLIVIIGQVKPDMISPAFSILGSFNDLSFFLGLGVVAVLITLRFLELSKRNSQALVISSVLALFLLAIANSSLIWTLIALVSLGLFVESVMHRGRKSADSDFDEVGITESAPAEPDSERHSLILPLCVLVVSLFFLVGGTLGSALAQALHINMLDVRPSWQSTYSVARSVYGTSPVFGSGPNTFGVEWLKHRDVSLNSTMFWNVDFSSGIGFIPTSSTTTGLLGVFAWVAFFALLIVFGLRMLIMRASNDAFTRYVAILSFVASLYLFTTAVFGSPNTVILVLAFVFTGLFVSTTRFADGNKQWGIIFSRNPRIGFVIVFGLTLLLLSSVVAAYSLVGRYVATYQLGVAGAAISAGNLDVANSAAQKSVSFAPSVTAYQIQAGVASTKLGQIVNSTTLSASAAQKAFQESLSAGINAAMTATRLAPSDYQSWIMLGNLYAQAVPLGVASAYDSAKSAYGKAQALNPTNPQIPYILAQLDIANKNIKGAEDNLKTAIGLKQDYTAAIFLLSQLEVQDGNLKDALSAALAAAYFQPNDPNILFQIGILYAAQNDLANAVLALSASVDANPQFANARYFLSAVYAKQGDYANALKQMQAIAAMSADNAKAVTTQLAALAAGKNPFPANLLSVSPSVPTPAPAKP